MVAHLRRLIATVVYVVICAWNFRVMNKTRQFPSQLAWFVEEGVGITEKIQKCKEIATLLLTKSDKDLSRESPFTDVHVKIKALCTEALTCVSETGRCCYKLYIFCLLLRA